MRLKQNKSNTSWFGIALMLSLIVIITSDTSEGTAISATGVQHEMIDCTQPDNDQHHKCIQLNKKNQTITEYCTELNTKCLKKCDQDTKCKDHCPVCPLNADQLINEALTEIKLTPNCRQYTTSCLKTCISTECRIDCIKRGCAFAVPSSVSGSNASDGTHTIVIHQENNSANGNSTVHKFESKFRPGQNVTTVIKLTNVVNNANRIETPVNITSHDSISDSNSDSNVSNSNPVESSTGGAFGLGFNAQGSCCLAIRPKSCRTSSTGLRCHHRRHRTCGPQCTSRTIHVQLRHRCHRNRNHGYRHGIAYVPQPRKPNCVYIDSWPYVSCTVAFERHLHEESCLGCYDHYGFGFHKYHEAAEHHRVRCRGCYDDAFEYGPLYRRGPVLRPYYYHQVGFNDHYRSNDRITLSNSICFFI